MKPLGSFNKDTVKLGELFEYALVYRHPPLQEAILPDSSYNFAPFELVQKKFTPTITRAGISTDSVVYVLRTFETAPVQQLHLPVFVLQNEDTIQVFTETKAVVLEQQVLQVQEPLVLKSETNLMLVPERFDWPRLLVWIVAVVVFFSLIWLIFGKVIQTNYKLYRLRKDYLYFASRYNAHVDRFVKSGSTQSVEKAVSLWKNYLTRLERSAINSFTTKEIVTYYNDDEEVNNALRLCDKAIYGNALTAADTETKRAQTKLKRFAKNRYKVQRELIRNVKNKR
ncbi:hypothetical protein C1N53_04865 [Pontibacter sp. SGAir0037]|nr:hypothetical protein C1N53_04865 [Pontibacter sp. SGAir0037]